MFRHVLLDILQQTKDQKKYKFLNLDLHGLCKFSYMAIQVIQRTAFSNFNCLEMGSFFAPYTEEICCMHTNEFKNLNFLTLWKVLKEKLETLPHTNQVALTKDVLELRFYVRSDKLVNSVTTLLLMTVVCRLNLRHSNWTEVCFCSIN